LLSAATAALLEVSNRGSREQGMEIGNWEWGMVGTVGVM